MQITLDVQKRFHCTRERTICLFSHLISLCRSNRPIDVYLIGLLSHNILSTFNSPPFLKFDYWVPQVLGRKTLGQPRSMRSLHFLIENNEKPEKCWSNGTKEEMKLQISIEIYLKFSKNLSFQLACGIQW